MVGWFAFHPPSAPSGGVASVVDEFVPRVGAKVPLVCLLHKPTGDVRGRDAIQAQLGNVAQVQPVADEDVREVVVVKVAHGGHLGLVHGRAHGEALGKRLGHRLLFHVATLHPQTAHGNLAAVRDAARVGSAAHEAVGAPGKAQARRVGCAEEAARIGRGVRRVARDVEGAAPGEGGARVAALGLGVQPGAVPEVAPRLARANRAKRLRLILALLVRVRLGPRGHRRREQVEVVEALRRVGDQVGAEGHDGFVERIRRVKMRACTQGVVYEFRCLNVPDLNGEEWRDVEPPDWTSGGKCACVFG